MMMMMMMMMMIWNNFIILELCLRRRIVKREKWCKSRDCLRDKVAACNSTVAQRLRLCRAIKGRTRARQNRRCDVGLSRRSSLVWIWCADERRLSRTVASRCVSIVPPARTPPYQICAPPPAAGGVPMGNGPSAGGPEFQAENFLTVFSLHWKLGHQNIKR